MKHEGGIARGHPEHHTNTGTNQPAEQPKASPCQEHHASSGKPPCDLN